MLVHVTPCLASDGTRGNASSPLPSTRRVGTVLWGHQRIGTPVFELSIGAPILRSRIVRLVASDGAVTAGNRSEDGLPALSWSRRVGEDGQLALRAVSVDATADGHRAYNRLLVENATPSAVAPGEWFRLDDPVLTTTVAPNSSLWCRLLDLHPTLGSVTLYIGPLEPVLLEPADAAPALEKIGRWPGSPDAARLADIWIEPRSGIGPETYLDQAERALAYAQRAAAVLGERTPVDLLLIGDPAVDGYRRGATLTGPDQWGYSPGAEQTARSGIHRLGLVVGDAVTGWVRFSEDHAAALMVVSPYELRPVHTAVRLPRWLSKHGVAVGRDGTVQVTCSGGQAHLEARDETSASTPDDVARLLRRAAHVLADLEVAGRPVVATTTVGRSPDTLHIQLSAGYTSACESSRPDLVPTRMTAETGFPGCGALLARPSGAPELGSVEDLWLHLASRPHTSVN